MANETVELYYKGKPINPNRDLPTRTYAEAQAEGLTSSDKLWVRNDAPQSDLIVDNLTTDDSARALSAKQGKVLGDKINSMFKYKTVTMNFGNNGRVALQNNTFTPDYTKIYNMYVKNESVNYYILFTTYASGRYAQLMNADTGLIVPNKSLEVVICYSE